MKRFLRLFLLIVAMVAVACGSRERTVVILSTNDMHAQIDSFPKLAAAVAACRDTAELVILVDAGDRVTGNAYSDLAEPSGRPMIELMNRLGFDVATLGNHEFDNGQAALGSLIGEMDFEVVCANVKSDTVTFPQLPPYVVVERGGLKIGFVGVVTNYEGPGHPAGHEENFLGLEFPDPQQMAAKYAAELRPKCDLMVLLSHMGDQYDLKFLAENPGAGYDMLIGGHTHKEIDEKINGVQFSQTGKYLKNIGVTTVRFVGRKVSQIDFRLVPLADYAPDPEFTAEVVRYRENPELNQIVGAFSAPADKWGLANWMASAAADETDAEIGLYHIGGVRLESLGAGDHTRAQLYNLEPFGARFARMRMTPVQLRRMILAKFNDTINIKEAGRIDLIATTPYEIEVMAVERRLPRPNKPDSLITMDSALDVRFPKLVEGRSYRVGMNDYMFKTYRDMEYVDGEITVDKVLDELVDELCEKSPVEPDNTPRQQIRRK